MKTKIFDILLISGLGLYLIYISLEAQQYILGVLFGFFSYVLLALHFKKAIFLRHFILLNYPLKVFRRSKQIKYDRIVSLRLIKGNYLEGFLIRIEYVVNSKLSKILLDYHSDEDWERIVSVCRENNRKVLISREI